MADAVAFALGTAMSIAATVLWCRRFLGEGGAVAAGAGIVLWVGVVVSWQLLLGIFGVLRPLYVHGGVLLIFGAVLWGEWRRAKKLGPVEDASRPPSASSRGQRLLTLLGVLAILYLLVEEVQEGVRRAPWDGDSLLYHLPILWYRYATASLWTLEAPFSHYPSYATLAGGWFWSPRWHDALMNLQNVPAYLLYVVALVRLAVCFGARPGSAWALTAVHVHSARMIARQITTQESDLWMAALLLAAAAWLLAPREDRYHRWLVGVALGLAMGCKYPGLPLVAMMALMGGLVVLRRNGPRAIASSLGGPMALAAALGVWPYLRNLLYAGTPFFPRELPALGWAARPEVPVELVFGSASQTMSLAEVLPRGLESWRALANGLYDHLGWMPWVGLIALVYLWRRPAFRDRRLGLGVFLVLGLGLLVFVPGFPRWEDAAVPLWLKSGYSIARFGWTLFAIWVAAAIAGVDLLVRALLARWPGTLGGGLRSSRPAAQTVLPWPRLILASVLVGSVVALALLGAAQHPAFEAARAESRFEEFERLHPGAMPVLRWVDAEWDGVDLLLASSKTWFFMGPQFENRIRRPHSSAIPLDLDPSPLEPRYYIVSHKTLREWSENPSIRPLLPELVELLYDDHGFQIWRY